jgi:polynucleotide 5'-kinase involved in rRNA processing
MTKEERIQRAADLALNVMQQIRNKDDLNDIVSKTTSELFELYGPCEDPKSEDCKKCSVEAKCMAVRRNKMIEIQVVGNTNTGKSTLANIICKLLADNRITTNVIDETDPINCLSKKSLGELLDRIAGKEFVIRVRQLNKNTEDIKK